MKSDHQQAEDACTIRGILELLEEPGAIITVQLVAMTQHVSQDTARRLMRNLAEAWVIERQVIEADVLGAKQKVPCIGWQITPAYQRGELVIDIEKLAGRI